MPKFCRDCKWMIKIGLQQPHCGNPKSENQIDLVTGELITNFCQVERMMDSGCGTEGLWWEQA